MDFDDKHLVAKARKGDKQAFTELYNHYANELFLFLRGRSNNREDALDLTSEVFIRVLRFLPSFRGDSSFRTWIYRIAKNLLVDYYTSHSKKSSLNLEEEQWLRVGANESDFSPDNLDNQESGQENPNVIKIIQAVLNRLPENYRTVIELHDLLNLSYAECAESMGIKENNAKVMHLRALNYARRITVGEKPDLEGNSIEPNQDWTSKPEDGLPAKTVTGTSLTN